MSSINNDYSKYLSRFKRIKPLNFKIDQKYGMMKFDLECVLCELTFQLSSLLDNVNIYNHDGVCPRCVTGNKPLNHRCVLCRKEKIPCRQDHPSWKRCGCDLAATLGGELKPICQDCIKECIIPNPDDYEVELYISSECDECLDEATYPYKFIPEEFAKTGGSFRTQITITCPSCICKKRQQQLAKKNNDNETKKTKSSVSKRTK